MDTLSPAPAGSGSYICVGSDSLVIEPPTGSLLFAAPVRRLAAEFQLIECEDCFWIIVCRTLWFVRFPTGLYGTIASICIGGVGLTAVYFAFSGSGQLGTCGKPSPRGRGGRVPQKSTADIGMKA